MADPFKDTEKDLQARILRYLRKIKDSEWVKFQAGPYTPKGIPDIIGCWKGRFFFFEVKLPARKNSVTNAQYRRMVELKCAGAIGGVVTSVEETQRIIEKQDAKET